MVSWWFGRLPAQRPQGGRPLWRAHRGSDGGGSSERLRRGGHHPAHRGVLGTHKDPQRPPARAVYNLV